MEIRTENILIKDLLQESVELLMPAANKNKNTIHINMNTEFDSITTDKIKFKQILLNLLSNTNKFTKEGVINIVVHSFRKEDNTWINIQISDTGIGISPKKLKHIFDEFFQAHDYSGEIDNGTGLGLAISSKLASLLQGDISAASSVGKGVTFTLSLPRVNQSCLLPTQQYVA